jgi:hypothetical protein
MKYIFIVLIVIPAFVQALHAQTGKRNSTSKAEAELLRIEREIGQANIRRDKAFFERIEAEEFLFTDSSGGLTTKTEDVASLDKPAGETKLVAYEVDNARVMLYRKAAVVTGRLTSTYRNKERETIVRSRFTDVFVKRDSRWQIVAGHSSRIREQQK